jgi:serine/threonine-protein kinase
VRGSLIERARFMKELIGETISHYRIVDVIGQGGMGLVYRAEDIRLKRTVALKFLPPELSLNPEAKARFIQEAQAASALQHNNICTVHDIDQTADGQMFIVMDLYNGETLKQKMEKGPIALAEAIGIAVQIGQGLSRAHERGIVHRDIKPANILVTDDRTIKILDFGLAKLGTGAMLTKVGTTLGTVAYMSPEQTRGEDVDQRTDVWSLGVILYQMLSGQHPFRADHDQAIIYSIQNSDPPALSTSSAPADCQQILTKALQKDPARRYQTAGEFVADLRNLQGILSAGESWGTQATPAAKSPKAILYGGAAGLIILIIAGIFFFRRGSESAGNAASDVQSLRRLAVLPFANLRSDPQTDFLGFALADQIIGNLAYVQSLIVRPSSAIRKYQTEPLDLATAGQKLNVDLVLTGNYLKELNTIRLSFELVDIHTNAILWREAIQEEYENTFKLEDTVARKVVDGLRMHFTPDELHQMHTDVPRNPLAYDFYLRGISYPVSMEGNRRAVSMFRQSIALDSTYAPTIGELGFRLHQIAAYTQGNQGLLHEAEAALLKALSLNDGLLSAYANLCNLYVEIGQTEKAFDLARKVLAINPNSPDGHFSLGYIFRYVGFLNRAEEEMELALRLDPNNPRFRAIGITYVYLGKYQKALLGLNVDSTSSFSLAWKGFTYFLLNQPELALPYLNRVIEMEHESSFGEFSQDIKHLNEKKYDLVKASLQRESLTTIDGESWYNFSELAGLTGDPAVVVPYLRRAIEYGFFNYPLMMKDTSFDSIRGNPEFKAIVSIARAKYEAFKVRYPELQNER